MKVFQEQQEGPGGLLFSSHPVFSKTGRGDKADSSVTSVVAGVAPNRGPVNATFSVFNHQHAGPVVGCGWLQVLFMWLPWRLQMPEPELGAGSRAWALAADHHHHLHHLRPPLVFHIDCNSESCLQVSRVLLLAPASLMTTPAPLPPSLPSTASACPPPPSFTEKGQHGVSPGMCAHLMQLTGLLDLVLPFLAPTSRGVMYHLVLTGTFYINLGLKGQSLVVAGSTNKIQGPGVLSVAPGTLAISTRPPQAAGRRTLRLPTFWLRWSTGFIVLGCGLLHRGRRRRHLSGFLQSLQR